MREQLHLYVEALGTLWGATIALLVCAAWLVVWFASAHPRRLWSYAKGVVIWWAGLRDDLLWVSPPICEFTDSGEHEWHSARAECVHCAIPQVKWFAQRGLEELWRASERPWTLAVLVPYVFESVVDDDETWSEWTQQGVF